MNTKDLAGKIRDWLETQGYPLEMKVASSLRNVGFDVMQSQYYLDPETNVPREIDIIAYKNDVMGECEISFIIECKTSRKKPWLLFTSENVLQGQNIFFNFGLLSDSAKSLLTNIFIKDHEKIINVPWVKKLGRVGYGLTQAFTSGDDIPYKASINVLKAAISKKIEFNKIQKYTPINVFFPVIIIDGEIFECFLDDNGEVIINEFQEGFISCALRIVNEFSPCIHIISAKKLDFFAEQAKDVSDKLLYLFEKAK